VNKRDFEGSQRALVHNWKKSRCWEYIGKVGNNIFMEYNLGSYHIMWEMRASCCEWNEHLYDNYKLLRLIL